MGTLGSVKAEQSDVLQQPYLQSCFLNKGSRFSTDQKFKTTAFKKSKPAKALKLSDVEHGRIVELHKQGLLKRAITVEVGHSKTINLHLIKDPGGYGG